MLGVCFMWLLLLVLLCYVFGLCCAFDVVNVLLYLCCVSNVLGCCSSIGFTESSEPQCSDALGH